MKLKEACKIKCRSPFSYFLPAQALLGEESNPGRFSGVRASLVTVGKESTCTAGDLGPIPGLGRSPGEGNGNPFQYSCLGSPTDRGPWRVTVHGVAKSQT